MDLLQSVHVKLLAADLLSLAIRSSSPPTFSRKGRLVSRAETVGVVVSRMRKDKFLKFMVDDGSGCIPCILWLNHHSFASSWRSPVDTDLLAEMSLEHAEMAQLGALVRVRGRIAVYRDELQITVVDIIVERDPNMEVVHWLDCIRLARQCYDVNPLENRTPSANRMIQDVEPNASV